MRIGLVSMGYLPFVRRRMRRAGLRLTVRHGKVYTIDAVETVQPDSAAQLRAQSILAQASTAAKRELEDEERRLYWDSNAAERGYKTGRGACVAYHIGRLKAMKENDAGRFEEGEAQRRADAERRRAETRRREDVEREEETIELEEFIRLMTMIMYGGERERLRRGRERMET